MSGLHSGAHALGVLENIGSATVSAPVLPFEDVYARYFDFVWASARRLGVDTSAIDDVVQEIFIAIHSRLHSLQCTEALKSWVYGITRRTVSNHRRALRARGGGATSSIEDDQFASAQPTPFEITQKNSELQLLAELLGKLDEPKRELFALVEIEEMTVPEVADALDIPLNTAYSRLRAARIAFEAALARLDARGERRRQPCRS